MGDFTVVEEVVMTMGMIKKKMSLGQFQKAPSSQRDDLSVEQSNNCSGFKCIQYV